LPRRSSLFLQYEGLAPKGAGLSYSKPPDFLHHEGLAPKGAGLSYSKPPDLLQTERPAPRGAGLSYVVTWSVVLGVPSLIALMRELHGMGGSRLRLVRTHALGIGAAGFRLNLLMLEAVVPAHLNPSAVTIASDRRVYEDNLDSPACPSPRPAPWCPAACQAAARFRPRLRVPSTSTSRPRRPIRALRSRIPRRSRR